MRMLVAAMAAAAVVVVAVVAPVRIYAEGGRDPVPCAGIVTYYGCQLEAAAAEVVSAQVSGQVLSLRLAHMGERVKQGAPLVFVRTFSGSAVPAAVAPFDGHVTQVFVSAGNFVNKGDPVAAVTPAAGSAAPALPGTACGCTF